MRKLQLIFFSIALISFLVSNSNAQVIVSLEIIPVNPTTTDSIKVISHTLHPQSNCPLTSYSLNQNNDTINVLATHTLGSLTTPCNSFDTLTIGLLNAGFYELRYQLEDSTVYDIDTIQIIVQQTNNILLNHSKEDKISVYPNPILSMINIDLELLSSELFKIDMYTVYGEKIKTFETNQDKLIINAKEIKNGIYYIVVTDDHNNRWTKKILIYAPQQ